MNLSLQPSFEEVSTAGKSMIYPAIKILDFTIIISGGLIKTARIMNEFHSSVEVTDPASIIHLLRKPRSRADIFTFSQKLPDTIPIFPYYYELDNIAVISISTYGEWWDHQINSNDRKIIRRAYKKGVEVKIIPFDDNLVRGIVEIYNETPFRQGRHFWHYGKDFKTVRQDISTDNHRSDFIGAYFEDELIGFIKIIYSGKCGNMNLILTKIKHRDKCPANALIAKAVEVCDQKGYSFLTYGKYSYGKKGEDSLSNFKRNCGFKKVDIPQYFIPLTFKGKIALKLGFHHFPYNLVPGWMLHAGRSLRSRWLAPGEKTHSHPE